MEDDGQPPEKGESPPPAKKRYSVTACSISYTKHPISKFRGIVCGWCNLPPSPPTYILRDVSFTATPSHLLAIVGPSGAGKSTLLDILAAHTTPTHGSLLLNSSPLHPSSFRKMASYVPQHDSYSISLLTVSETFLFAATLLLPNSPHLSSLVTSLLSDLRLSHLSNTRLACGLSGGERRRVSIGLSLLHDPSVLLLDEPTSGLDSASAFNVIQTLRTIAASRHRTVILSIHQPSFKILSSIDTILLLSKGTLVHHGTLSSLETFLASNDFHVPAQLNALEYAMELLDQLSDQKKQPAADAPVLHEEESHPINHVISSSSSSSSDRERIIEMRYTSSRFHEILTLYCRFWKIIYRTKQLLLTNTLEALGVGILLGTLYINVGLDKQGMDKRLGLFAFTLTFLLSSTTETLPIFVNERPILLRETSSGVYRLSSHLMANTLVFLPYLLVIALIYSVSVYFLVGLCSSWQAFAYFVLVIWVVLLMANSFVLFLSSVAPNYIAGTSLVTIFLACFFLFSGYFLSKDSIPQYWIFMYYFSLYKYALDALLINEYSCLASKCLIWYEDKKLCAVTGRDVLEKRGLKESQRWRNVQIMLGFFVFYRVLCLLLLTRRASRSKT